MSQSKISILKLFGKNAIEKYRSFSEQRVENIVSICQLLEKETEGKTYIFKSMHYDPTSIAVAELILDMFPLLFTRENRQFFRNETISILSVYLPHATASSLQHIVDIPHANIIEIDILCYLIRQAVLFWIDLFIENQIDCLLFVIIESIGPSIIDSHIINGSK